MNVHSIKKASSLHVLIRTMHRVKRTILYDRHQERVLKIDDYISCWGSISAAAQCLHESPKGCKRCPFPCSIQPLYYLLPQQQLLGRRMKLRRRKWEVSLTHSLKTTSLRGECRRELKIGRAAVIPATCVLVVILCENLFESGFQVVEGGQGRLRQSEVQGE